MTIPKEKIKELSAAWTHSTTLEHNKVLDLDNRIETTLTKKNFEDAFLNHWWTIESCYISLCEGAGDGMIDIDYRPTPKKAIFMLRDYFDITENDDFEPYVYLVIKYKDDDSKTKFQIYDFIM